MLKSCTNLKLIAMFEHISNTHILIDRLTNTWLELICVASSNVWKLATIIANKTWCCLCVLWNTSSSLFNKIIIEISHVWKDLTIEKNPPKKTQNQAFKKIQKKTPKILLKKTLKKPTTSIKQTLKIQREKILCKVQKCNFKINLKRKREIHLIKKTRES